MGEINDSFWMRIAVICLCIFGSTLLCQLNRKVTCRGGLFLARMAHLSFDGYTLIWTTLLLQSFVEENKTEVAEKIFMVVGCVLHLIVALTSLASSFANNCVDVGLLFIGIVCMLVFAIMLTDLVLGFSRKGLSMGKRSAGMQSTKINE